jgi:tetratricopeptide (TPR) repeat protein
MARVGAMPSEGAHMAGMVEYYDGKFPIFYALEMRDWQTASTLKPQPGSLPEVETITWWARAVADGHLKRAVEAQADLAHYDALIAEVRKGKHAYYADSTGTAILRDEIAAWASYAGGKNDDALKQMRAGADLQDKVGQGEVDIPAREMLGDMLLELGRAQEALVEYRVATRLSPNRFNGLYNAGRAAEAAGQKDEASTYYAALLKSTADGAASQRPEIAHAKSFVASGQLAHASQ